MTDGWIKIHRKLFDNPLWLSEPFTRAQAWVDMIGMANYRDGFYFKRGIRIDVKRGQLARGVDWYANRWRWSRGKVERFFKMLETDRQIERQKTNVITLISIVNYDAYQADGNADDITDSNPSSKANDKAGGTQTVKQTETYNKEKKVKESKEEEKKEPLFSSAFTQDYINNSPESINQIQVARFLKEFGDESPDWRTVHRQLCDATRLMPYAEIISRAQAYRKYVKEVKPGSIFRVKNWLTQQEFLTDWDKAPRPDHQQETTQRRKSRAADLS